MDILVKNLTKSFQGRTVLHDFSCHIPKGGKVCIMGPSGVGKTTLLNILMGLVNPDSGTVEGIPYGRLGVVFQEERLCENLSAMRNIRLVCRQHHTEESIQEAFLALGLEDALRRPVRELSGGMRRRVSILRALFADADCLILDEPFQGLDEDSKTQAIAYIREKSEGKTLILVTHDKEEAEGLGIEQMIQV